MTLQQKQEMEIILQDKGGSQKVKNILKYICMNMSYSNNQDTVVYYPHYKFSEVFYDDILIARVDKNNQHVYLPSVVHKKAIKERLNRILMRFCGVQLFQKEGAWYIIKPQESEQIIVGDIFVPFFV